MTSVDGCIASPGIGIGTCNCEKARSCGQVHEAMWCFMIMKVVFSAAIIREPATGIPKSVKEDDNVSNAVASA